MNYNFILSKYHHLLFFGMWYMFLNTCFLRSSVVFENVCPFSKL